MISSNYPVLADCEAHSRETLLKLRSAVLVLDGPWEYAALFALGSYGRLEAQPKTSDFEWLVVYDDTRVAHAEAESIQARATALFASVLGRECLSVNKTFGQTASFHALGTNVGGLAETNRMLTYRMLCLTEGTVLTAEPGHARVMRSLAKVYAGSHSAGHRLLSLASDIARYYRTVRVAYKFNVDEARKPWAVRNIKTRVLRRMAFAGSAFDFVANGPRIDYKTARDFDIESVVAFLRGMSTPPAIRFEQACTQLGVGVDSVRSVLKLYNDVVGALASPQKRQHLDELGPEYRHDDAVWEDLREQCGAFHTGLADLLISMPSEPRGQVIEMFLF